ncbi:hypothetical protein GOBAR_DD17447 [Gossypium barbadense]|nr:hypothetical protein GOBAR_DD17447 [Gossypium barbadense]
MESNAQWEVGDRLGDKWYLGAAPLQEETRESITRKLCRRLPRAIDLAELALAVGALLFSEATEEGSYSTVKWRKWNS